MGKHSVTGALRFCVLIITSVGYRIGHILYFLCNILKNMILKNDFTMQKNPSRFSGRDFMLCMDS